jgi:hypothetical protein
MLGAGYSMLDGGCSLLDTGHTMIDEGYSNRIVWINSEKLKEKV